MPEEDTDAPQLHRGHRLVTASQRDHGPAGVFGVWLTSTGAEVSHEPPEQPDVVLVTRTDALVAASGCDDLDGLERADIVGDREVVRSLMTRVRIPSSTVQH